jgi:autotransporter family porin
VRNDGRKWQPYATVNEWHSTVSSNISFNELPLGSLYPESRYGLKLGMNADSANTAQAMHHTAERRGSLGKF